jgi:chemotaxis protein CheD
MNDIVGVSDLKVSRDKEATLSTYSLGSCIGVAVYDPGVGVGALLHFQLPSGDMDKARAQASPAMFADTGMAALLERMGKLGALERRMQITIAGGAQMLNDTGMFNIGRRNHAAIRKLLWQRGLLIRHEDVGGPSPRNLCLRVADGAVLVKVVGLAAAAA